MRTRGLCVGKWSLQYGLVRIWSIRYLGVSSWHMHYGVRNKWHVGLLQSLGALRAIVGVKQMEALNVLRAH